MNQKNQMNKNGERELLVYLVGGSEKTMSGFGGVMSSERGRLSKDLWMPILRT